MDTNESETVTPTVDETVGKTVDWELIEREYKAGVISTRKIADAAGITESAIRKRAAKYGWKRNLTKDIQHATRAKLAEQSGAQDAGRGAQSGARTGLSTGKHLSIVQPSGPTDAEIVEGAAVVAAGIVTEHRASAKKARTAITKLMDQLLVEIGNVEGLRAVLDEAVTQEVKDGQITVLQAGAMRGALRAVLSMPGLSKAAQQLAGALNTISEIERKAYGLDDKEGGGEEDYETRLQRLHDAGLVNMHGSSLPGAPKAKTGTDG